MTQWPEVTVVLPTRNRAGFLAGALQSALGQDSVELEVIVIDDGSTDSTPEVLRGASDSRLWVIRNDTSRGVAAARNQALRQASGTWLAFLDDDDLWAPRWLRTALDAADGIEPALIYGAHLHIDGERRALRAVLAHDPATVPSALFQYNALGGPSAIIVHRDAVAAVGAFDERLSALADWEAWMRLVEAAQPVVVPEPLVGYTAYPDNMHRRDAFGVLDEFHRFCTIVAERHGADRVPPELPFVRWLADDAAEMRNRWTAARLYARAGRAGSPLDLARALRCLGGATPSPPPAFAAPAWLSTLSGGRIARPAVGARA
jgi:glycosyltransferase involved in cell wall biosynthesis